MDQAKEYPLKNYLCPECGKPTRSIDPEIECNPCSIRLDEQAGIDERAVRNEKLEERRRS